MFLLFSKKVQVVLQAVKEQPFLSISASSATVVFCSSYIKKCGIIYRYDRKELTGHSGNLHVCSKYEGGKKKEKKAMFVFPNAAFVLLFSAGEFREMTGEGYHMARQEGGSERERGREQLTERREKQEMTGGLGGEKEQLKNREGREGGKL